jgi:hypothetical protein
MAKKQKIPQRWYCTVFQTPLPLHSEISGFCFIKNKQSVFLTMALDTGKRNFKI